MRFKKRDGRKDVSTGRWLIGALLLASRIPLAAGQGYPALTRERPTGYVAESTYVAKPIDLRKMNLKRLEDECGLKRSSKKVDASEYRSCAPSGALDLNSAKMIDAVNLKLRESAEANTIRAGNRQIFRQLAASLPIVATPGELVILKKIKSGALPFKSFCTTFKVAPEFCSQPDYKTILIEQMKLTEGKDLGRSFLKQDSRKQADEMIGMVQEVYSSCLYGKPEQARARFLEDSMVTAFFLSDAFGREGQDSFKKFSVKDFGKDSPPEGYRGMLVSTGRKDTCMQSFATVCRSVCGSGAGCEDAFPQSISCNVTSLERRIDEAKADFRESALKEIRIAGLNETPGFGGYRGWAGVPGYGSNLTGMVECMKTPSGKFRSYALYHQFHHFPAVVGGMRNSFPEARRDVLDQLYCDSIECNEAVESGNETLWGAAKLGAIGMALIPGVGGVVSTLVYAGLEEGELLSKVKGNWEEAETLRFGAFTKGYKNHTAIAKQLDDLKDRNLYNFRMMAVTAVSAAVMIKVADPLLERGSKKVSAFFRANPDLAKNLGDSLYKIGAPLQKLLETGVKKLPQGALVSEVEALAEAEANTVARSLATQGVKLGPKILSAMKHHFAETAKHDMELLVAQNVSGTGIKVENEGPHNLMGHYSQLTRESLAFAYQTISGSKDKTPEQIKHDLEQDPALAGKK